ncbi:MAG: radical SAM peptide maturase [Tenuifilaceae bacterium]|jgi:uncharacterized protein|nr:radical SAM peptide maturase [Bacteroidales bacterium]MDY0202283.1 radical SAM peptide maturase [Tenuifilaceae bacterium]
MKAILTKTDFNNHYYIARKSKLIGYLHPEIYKYFQNTESDIISTQNPKYSQFKSDEKYYERKYNFLKEHILSNETKEINNCTRRIEEVHIKDGLDNIEQVVFEVTSSCNLKCRYCAYGEFYSYTHTQENRNMDFSTAKTVVDFFVRRFNTPDNKSFKGTTFISFYGGEPLLNMGLIKKIIEYIKGLEVNRNFIFSMTTNGVLLMKHIDFLVDNSVRLLISLDGDNEGNQYRVDRLGFNSFPVIISNVKLIKEKYPDFFKEYVNFIAVLHNKNSVESIMYFFKKNFDKVPMIAPLNTSGILPEKTEEFKNIYHDYIDSINRSNNPNRIVTELGAKSPEIRDTFIFCKQYGGTFFEDYSELFSNNATLFPTGTCFPFGRKMFIATDGSIHTCEKIDYRYSFGSVIDKTIRLNSKFIVETFNRYLDNISKSCSSCYMLESCPHCLYLIDDIENENAKCPGYLNYEDFSKKCSTILSRLEKNREMFNEIVNDIIFV